MKLCSYPSPCTKLNSKGIKGLNMQVDIPKITKEKVGHILDLIGTRKYHVNWTLIAWVLRLTTDK